MIVFEILIILTDEQNKNHGSSFVEILKSLRYIKATKGIFYSSEYFDVYFTENSKNGANGESAEEDFSSSSIPISELVVSMVNEERVSWVVSFEFYKSAGVDRIFPALQKMRRCLISQFLYNLITICSL